MEFLIILLYVIFCLFSKKKWIICSLILLFPGHLFFKNILEVFRGEVIFFPLWYDIGIFTLLIKTLLGRHCKYTMIKSLIILFLVLVVLYTSTNDSEALTTLRIHLHCIALFVIWSVANFKKEDYILFKRTIIYATLFYCLTGIIIYFFFQWQMHLLLGHLEMTPQGWTYTSPSFQIMGFERMFGMIGGPNQFGVYMSFTFIALLFTNRGEEHSYEKLPLVLSGICLILSFSRAGWAVSVITIIIYNILYGKGKQFFYSIIKFTMTASVALFVLALIVPEVSEIITASITGKEASAANRGDIVKNGFDEIATDFYGHGLGTGIDKSGPTISESSMVILLYELGVFVTILYYYILLKTSFFVYKKNVWYSYLLLAFVIATLITSVVSMNIFQYPYIYYLWSIVGLAANKRNIIYLRRNGKKITPQFINNSGHL